MTDPLRLRETWSLTPDGSLRVEREGEGRERTVELGSWSRRSDGAIVMRRMGQSEPERVDYPEPRETVFDLRQDALVAVEYDPDELGRQGRRLERSEAQP